MSRYADGPTDPADVAAYEHDEAAAAVAHVDGTTGDHSCPTCETVIDHAYTHAGFAEPGCALCVAEARTALTVAQQRSIASKWRDGSKC